MNRSTPQLRKLATRLIENEAGKDPSPASEFPPAFQVFERLRGHLAPMMGRGGYRALLSRALALATMELPRLHQVGLKADGALDWTDKPRSPIDREHSRDGGVVLLAQFLGLLMALIGEPLTWTILQGAWGAFPHDDAAFLDLTKNENVEKKP